MVILLPGERLPFAATGTSVRKRAPYGYALPTTNHIESRNLPGSPAHETSWASPKHRKQRRNTLATYAFPIFGGLPVSAIDTALVMKCLDPIWHDKTETASRLRGRIEQVLDWAKVRGFREGENPARWKGHLDKLLPAKNKIAKAIHHAALPYVEIGVFMAELARMEGIGARALEFAILTAARSGEVRGATWNEIDLNSCMWIEV